MFKTCGCLVGLVAVFVFSSPTFGQTTQVQAPITVQTGFLNESQEERDQRMQWWREARFGMFIHWGLYAVPAGVYKGETSDRVGEWIQAWANIPRKEYEKFAAQFNPVKFDADEWAELAQNAGMRYMVITSKHHDGFALFDSATSRYDIADSTPYKRDPIAELSRACKKRGIRFCFYYSIMDWHHPSQYVEAEGKLRTAGHGQNKVIESQKPHYIGYMTSQLAELVEKYDPEVLWFDGEWVDWWTEEDGKDLYNFVRNLKPSIIINNRVGKGRDGMRGLNKGTGYAGDFGTPEQEIPATGLPGVDWESCMTMNNTWGYKSYDANWKSAETLIQNLIDIASKGGNYLLNVGPRAEGLIPEESVARLKAIGEWLKVNGESIYSTHASPFENLEWGRATQKDDKVYLHVFDWPQTTLLVPALERRVKRAYLLADSGRDLDFTQSTGSIEVQTPKETPDPIAAVVVLELGT